MATPINSITCISLQTIDGTDCLGDSRDIINSNVTNLGTAICTLSSRPIPTFNLGVTDSSTVDLTLSYSSSLSSLSADVKQNSIRYSHLASWTTLSGSPTLSAEAVSQSLAKAWVNFNGTGSSGTATVNAGYNIASITNLATGQFKIFFKTPLNTPYVALVTGYDTTSADDPITGVIHDLQSSYCTVGTMRSDDTASGNATTYVCVVFFGF
jgi:hypothetical protein